MATIRENLEKAKQRCLKLQNAAREGDIEQLLANKDAVAKYKSKSVDLASQVLKRAKPAKPKINLESKVAQLEANLLALTERVER